MKVRAQIAMVLNLDKCIGCHTCSVTCKNVWTSREGVEYAWFNNVETKPGVGYPEGLGEPEALEGRLEASRRTARSSRASAPSGASWPISSPIPTCRKSTTTTSRSPSTTRTCRPRPRARSMPTARPRSLITGERMEKIEWGPNWEEILGGEFAKRSKDCNFEGVQKEIYGAVRKHLHDVSAAPVRALPEPGLRRSLPIRRHLQARGGRHRPDRPGQVPRLAHVRIRHAHTRRSTTTGRRGKSEKCIFCYPRIEAGLPTVCSETCVGRIRYLGVVLYDADRIADSRVGPDDGDLYEAQLKVFLDPFDPKVQAQARADGISGGVAGSRKAIAGVEDGDGLEDRVPAASRNTARCRWSGTCRRCRRSSRPLPRATSARSAACRM